MIDASKSKFQVIVKPNSKISQIKGFDKERNTYLIDIKAKAEDNKANIELIKLLSKTFRNKVRICSGFRSRSKVIEVIE